jgi:hypothetical protein
LRLNKESKETTSAIDSKLVCCGHDVKVNGPSSFSKSSYSFWVIHCITKQLSDDLENEEEAFTLSSRRQHNNF